MINYKILFLLTILLFIPLIIGNSFAQIKSGGFGQSPFEREFGDVKLLDAYFGTINKKIEIEPGDEHVPFTVVFANVGTQDITGIKGQLSLPIGFSSADGHGSLIIADSDSNSLAGDNFHLTFYVDIDKNIRIQQYPGTIKVDYSRLRESGVRTAFSDFNFKITGTSIINIKALDPFLTSLKSNNVIIEISNDGTGPMSSVSIVATKAQTELSSTSSSTSNVENVVLLESNWDIGNIKPKSSRYLTATVYIPGNLKEDTLRIPLSISYYNAHGELQTISKIVDFYIKGLINLSIYDVGVIELSGKQMVVGEIINEGNENALFGFITLEPLGNSNIKKQTQFIDEVETDSPVPFNIPLEFDGKPQYGEHNIKLTVRYKDSVRDEIFITHNATISVKEPPKTESGNNSHLIIIPLIIVIAIGVYMIRRRKKSKIQAN
ncbi:MAG: COG1361 S-layer family protein [Nitrosarchaeum sp.]